MLCSHAATVPGRAVKGNDTTISSGYGRFDPSHFDTLGGMTVRLQIGP
jgi:hypothetical protein